MRRSTRFYTKNVHVAQANALYCLLRFCANTFVLPMCRKDKITHTTFLKTGFKGGWNRICLHLGQKRIFGKSYVVIGCPRTFRSPNPKPAFSRFANKSLLYDRVAGLLATVTTILKPLFGGTWGCGFVKLSAFQQPFVKIDCFSAIISGPETAGCKSTEKMLRVRE